MTISSIIVKLKDESYKNDFLQKITKQKECEAITEQKENIICVVTTKNTDEQITIFRTIQNYDIVDDISMVYNYEELDEELDKIKNAPKISEILSDDFDADNVIYKGSVNYKVK